MTKSESCSQCGAAQAPRQKLYDGRVYALCLKCWVSEAEFVFRAVERVSKEAKAVGTHNMSQDFEMLDSLVHDVSVRLPDMIANLCITALPSTFEPTDLLDDDTIPF